MGPFGPRLGMSSCFKFKLLGGIHVGGQVAGRLESNWGPAEFKEGNLIKSANSSRRWGHVVIGGLLMAPKFQLIWPEMWGSGLDKKIRTWL